MARRQILIKESASEGIANIAAFIISKGLLVTADKFIDEIHEFMRKLGDERKSYPLCQEPKRKKIGYKCVAYKKKFTIVFLESESQLIICEFISSKMIYW